MKDKERVESREEMKNKGRIKEEMKDHFLIYVLVNT